MLKQKYKKKLISFSLLPLLLSLILVLSFQNCDRLIMTEDGSNKASGNGQGYDGLSSSGNGQGYDGFASTTGVYYQYVENVNCGISSSPSYSSKIDFGTPSAPLNPPLIYNNQCSNYSPINSQTDYLSYKPYSDKIITYEKGIFEKFDQLPTSVTNSPVAFCQSTLDANTGLDVLVRHNNTDGAYTAEIYVGVEQAPSAAYRYEKRFVEKFIVSRSNSTLNTVYRANSFNLLLRAANANNNSDGSISTTIDGVNYSNLPMICKHQAPVTPTLLPAPISAGPAPTNMAPNADFSFSCNSLTCNFINLSSDSDGSIVSSNWNMGDSTGSAQTHPIKTYGAYTSYNVSVTVTDNRGNTGTVTKNVTLTRPSNINIGVNSTSGIDSYFLNNNTIVTVIYSEAGASTTATGWIQTSTTAMAACPAIADYRPLSDLGWSLTGGDYSTQIFINSPGVATSVSLCLRNSSTGTTSKLQLSFR